MKINIQTTSVIPALIHSKLYIFIHLFNLWVSKRKYSDNTYAYSNSTQNNIWPHLHPVPCGYCSMIFFGSDFFSACHSYVYNSGFWYLHLNVGKYVWNMNWMLLSSLSNINCCKNLGCNIFHNTMVIHHSV